MWFCPFCGNLLQVHASQHSDPKFSCSTCPYHRVITKTKRNKLALTPKVKDDVLGGAAAWDNVDRTAATCEACNHHEAYFLQMQIRSADEPMSVFYKCCKCSNQWADR